MVGAGLPCAFGVFNSDVLFVRAMDGLRSSGFGLVRVRTFLVSSLPKRAGPILLEAGILDDNSAYGSLLAGRQDLGPWLIVAPEEDHDSGDPNTVLLLPRCTARLVSELRWAWLDALASRFTGAVDETACLHFGLRAALALIVSPARNAQLFWTRRGEASSSPLVAGQLGWLSARIGISSDHLSRLARKREVPLKAIKDMWRMTLSIILRMEEGSWEKAAFLLGFESVGGLTALANRTLRSNLRALGQEPAFGLGRAEQCLIALIRGGSPQGREEDVGDRLA